MRTELEPSGNPRASLTCSRLLKGRTALALLVVGIAGCASTGVTPELADARHAYDNVRYSDANSYAPARVLEARQALERAEQAHAHDAGSFEEKSLAYVAVRRAKLATTYAEIEKSRREELLAEQQYQEKQAALRRAAEQEAENARRSLESARTDLNEARRALTTEQQTSAVRLADERQRREQAEKEAAAAVASLQEIAKVKEESRGTVITLEGSVLFVTGKSELLPIARQRLDRVAEVLKKVDEEKLLVVEGHTDSRGSDEANQKLSLERAVSVREYLISRGIKPERIQASGQGELRPVAPNDTPEGRAQNRRVELIIQNARRNNNTPR